MTEAEYYDGYIEPTRPTCPECGCQLRLDCDVTDTTYGVEFWFWVCDGCGHDCDEVPLLPEYQ